MGRRIWARHNQGCGTGADAVAPQIREVLQLELSQVTHAELLEAASRSKLSLAQFVEQALVVAEWISDERGKGSEFLLRTQDGDERSITVGLLDTDQVRAAV